MAATQTMALLLCGMVAAAAPGGARIEVVEGDGAINNIRLHRAKEPVVRVVDESGKPLRNVAVTFLLPGPGPGGTFADGLSSMTILTDDNGLATGRGLRPNSIAGQFRIQVSAAYEGQPLTAKIMQTNAEPAKGGSSKTILIIALIGGAAAGAAVGLAGKHGSSTTTTPPPNSGVVITPGNPSFGGPPK
jgi:hypothetical protein